MVKICNDSYPQDSQYNSYFQKYKFPLSDFQKYAIEAIIKGQHALVTAHTGSGKTLPAEFAIEYFVEKGKKLIYTSPIKALSNQKYSEFRQVTAKGSPDVALSWIFDLQLGMARLFGQLCSAALDSKKGRHV